MISTILYYFTAVKQACQPSQIFILRPGRKTSLTDLRVRERIKTWRGQVHIRN